MVSKMTEGGLGLSSDSQASDEINEEEDRFLVYSLGGDSYASRLIDVVEVIKAGKIKKVPHTASHFVGIANLRGRIVSVIDLRHRFGIDPECSDDGLILVIPSGDQFFGLLVDDVLAVERIEKEEMNTNFSLDAKVPIEFLIAVAMKKEKLLSIVDLSKVLQQSDFVNVANLGLTQEIA